MKVNKLYKYSGTNNIAKDMLILVDNESGGVLYGVVVHAPTNSGGIYYTGQEVVGWSTDTWVDVTDYKFTIEKPITYKMGDRFQNTDSGDQYILSSLGSRYMILVSIVSGNSWGSLVKVANHLKVTETEFKLLGDNKFIKVSGWDISSVQNISNIDYG